jgi:hypothetical protein
LQKTGLSDFMSGLLIMCFSLLMLWECSHTKHVLWPVFVLCIILICSIILIKQSNVNLKNFHISKVEKINETEKKNWLRFFSMVILHFGYYIAFHWIGFLISTPIFLALAMFFLGGRNKIKVVFLSFSTSLFFIFLFNYLLGVYLPKGILITKYLSFLIFY